jgi:hypothetical protein
MRHLTIYGLAADGSVIFAAEVCTSHGQGAHASAWRHLDGAERVEIWEGPVCISRLSRGLGPRC